MFSRALCIGLFVSLSLIQQASSQNAAWVYPPIGGPAGQFQEDKLFQIGSTQTLSWQSSLPTAAINIYQQQLDIAGSNASSLIVENVVANEFKWIVDVSNFDLKVSPVFYLGLTTTSDTQQAFVLAHYVNITKDVVTSSSSSSSSIATTTRSSPSSVSSTHSSSSSSPTQKGNTNKGLGSGAIAGISVACTIAGILFLVGLCYYLYKRRKRSRQPPAEAAQNAENAKMAGMSGQDQNAQWQRAELDNTEHRAELEGRALDPPGELEGRALGPPGELHE